jgi:sulfur carrier protein ThiS
MRIRVKLFGTLRRLSRQETPGLWEGEVPEGATIQEMLHLIGAGKYEANAAAINGEPCSLDDIIPADSEITVVTPMGGG